MIAEIIFARVAPSLAKAVLFTWLKDHRAEASSSIVDIIADIVPAVRERNTAKRLFEAIGERVAESLLQTLEFEGTKLENNRKEAVLLEIEAVFDQNQITPELLIEVNLDPNQLADKLITRHNKRIRFFDAMETNLFERLVRDACNLVVDVASQLPSFSERSIGEILKREAQMLVLVEDLVNQINEIKLTSQYSNSERTGQIFEQNYRLTVNRKLDELELFGVDLNDIIARKQSLTIAYITLNVKETIGDDNNDGESDVLMSADRALSRQRLLLVRGQAGSGKTTLMSWIAVSRVSASRTT